MDITREQIVRRKDQLIRAREELQANLQAYNGAIQDCDYWLGVVEEDYKEGEDNPSPSP